MPLHFGHGNAFQNSTSGGEMLHASPGVHCTVRHRHVVFRLHFQRPALGPETNQQTVACPADPSGIATLLRHAVLDFAIERPPCLATFLPSLFGTPYTCQTWNSINVSDSNGLFCRNGDMEIAYVTSCTVLGSTTSPTCPLCSYVPYYNCDCRCTTLEIGTCQSMWNTLNFDALRCPWCCTCT